MGKRGEKIVSAAGTAAKGKRTRASSGGGATEKKMPLAWAKSTCSAADLQELREAGFIPEDESLAKIPTGEVIPSPPPSWVVVFIAYFFRGFSLPTHEFFRDRKSVV